MDEVKLALEINKLIHNECKDVPHDIGWRIVKDIFPKYTSDEVTLLTDFSVPLPSEEDCINAAILQVEQAGFRITKIGK